MHGNCAVYPYRGVSQEVSGFNADRLQDQVGSFITLHPGFLFSHFALNIDHLTLKEAGSEKEQRIMFLDPGSVKFRGV